MLGPELGHATVAAVLNGVVDVAEGVVADDREPRGVGEDEGGVCWRTCILSHRFTEACKKSGESQEEHFGGGGHFSQMDSRSKF